MATSRTVDGFVGNVLAMATVMAVGGVYVVSVAVLTAWGTVTALVGRHRGSRTVCETD